MTEIINTLENYQLIKILGGLGIIISAFAIFIGRMINQRLLSKWELTNNKEISELQGSVNQNNLIISNLLTLYGNNFQKVLEKRILATEFLWNSIIQLRESIPSPIGLVFQIFHDDEFKVEILNKTTSKIADQILMINQESEISKLVIDRVKINQYRIYFSDQLWLLYFTYRAFIGRSVYSVIEGVKSNNIILWKNDQPFLDVLKNVLSENEIDYLKAQKFSSFYYLLDILESKIMIEIKKLTSNDEITTDSLALLKKVKLIEEAK